MALTSVGFLDREYQRGAGRLARCGRWREARAGGGGLPGRRGQRALPSAAEGRPGREHRVRMLRAERPCAVPGVLHTAWRGRAMDAVSEWRAPITETVSARLALCKQLARGPERPVLVQGWWCARAGWINIRLVCFGRASWDSVAPRPVGGVHDPRYDAFRGTDSGMPGP